MDSRASPAGMAKPRAHTSARSAQHSLTRWKPSRGQLCPPRFARAARVVSSPLLRICDRRHDLPYQSVSATPTGGGARLLSAIRLRFGLSRQPRRSCALSRQPIAPPRISRRTRLAVNFPKRSAALLGARRFFRRVERDYLGAVAGDVAERRYIDRSPSFAKSDSMGTLQRP